MEETELLRKSEEEAREQSERLGMREEEAREQGERLRQREEEAREQTERLRKRKESQILSYSAAIQQSLHHRNIVRDRVLPAEQLQAYINLGEWGHVLPQK
ncbi:hypothetical protein B484DRAFT_435689, partial [Ochromonadaceae sp. CCMP2298]